MSRVKRSVHARKKRRDTLSRAKGYRGEKHSSYKRAKEQLLKSDSYAYRDRRNKKRDFRRLWITRINAAARQHGMSYSQFMHGMKLAGIEPPATLGVLLAEDVAAHGMARLDLALRGQTEALLGAGVGLHLRHGTAS